MSNDCAVNNVFLFEQITPDKIHTVIVVSPTISLIEHQKYKLHKTGINVEAIYGAVKQSTTLSKYL